MTKFEEMENAIFNLLEEEGLEADVDGGSDETHFSIDYVDGNGLDGSVDIYIYEGDDAYELSTSKESDDWEPKNEKRVKTVRAVKNYLNRVIVSVRP